ncbi:hypothetical protein PHJA_001257000 [Phtheirospermum japonicum]|uniref:Uncharacterized protein n=1 Tax=Phtheirospermum japonicum TaxID=374723 RepID=A0A830BUJ4_9LAMI|nr:hypothetical protein PHJA_001257000 [Phtheirospermum japonicum]
MALYNCPRISFSVDFADSQPPPIQLQNSYREAPVSSDFEFFGFSGSNDTSSMISADELFFKGRMLPSKENCPRINTTTLRDELLASDDEDNLSTTRPVKGAGRWRERLGLKRSHKKGEKINNDDGGLGRINEMVCEDVYGNFKGFGLRY